MDHRCNKALISNENRSYLKERRPKTRKIKKRFYYKYNLISRAPHLLATLQPLLIVLITLIRHTCVATCTLNSYAAVNLQWSYS